MFRQASRMILGCSSRAFVRPQALNTGLAARLRPVGSAPRRCLFSQEQLPRVLLSQDDEKKAQLSDADIPSAFRPGDPDPRPLVEAKEALKRGDLANAYALHDEAGAVGSAGILDKYGVLPLALLGGAALISKEIMFLNEETVVLGTWTAFVTTCYVAFNETVGKALDREIYDTRKEMEDALDSYIHAMEASLEAYGLAGHLLDDLRDMQEEYKKAREAAILAQARGFQLHFKRDIKSLLARMAEGEKSMFEKIGVELAERVGEKVRSDLANADDATQDAAITAALNHINGNVSGGSSSDPVASKFRSYYGDYVKKLIALGAGKPIPKDHPEYAELRAKAATDVKAFMDRAADEIPWVKWINEGISAEKLTDCVMSAGDPKDIPEYKFVVPKELEEMAQSEKAAIAAERAQFKADRAAVHAAAAKEGIKFTQLTLLPGQDADEQQEMEAQKQ